MEVQLAAISPFSFMIVKEGELVRIQRKPPKPNEYREKIGPPSECYLVVKGQTKIGMIPSDVISQHKELTQKKRCRIVKMDKDKSIIIVRFEETSVVVN
jgi:hypothetical protein